MKLPVCSVAMTVDYNKIHDIRRNAINKYAVFENMNRHENSKVMSVWADAVYRSLLNDLCACKSHKYPCLCYLRAKEKWAEALGEKFLGLSCGLVPARKRYRRGDKINLKEEHK